MALPDTTDRVAKHTAEKINQRIARKTMDSITFYRNHVDKIPGRLRALNREWDIERALETNASTLIVVTCILGFAVDSIFFAIPLLVGAFLLQHALQGWCPPLPLMRRLGFRTASEIEVERKALQDISGKQVHIQL